MKMDKNNIWSHFYGIPHVLVLSTGNHLSSSSHNFKDNTALSKRFAQSIAIMSVNPQLLLVGPPWSPLEQVRTSKSPTYNLWDPVSSIYFRTLEVKDSKHITIYSFIFCNIEKSCYIQFLLISLAKNVTSLTHHFNRITTMEAKLAFSTWPH